MENRRRVRGYGFMDYRLRDKLKKKLKRALNIREHSAQNDLSCNQSEINENLP